MGSPLSPTVVNISTEENVILYLNQFSGSYEDIFATNDILATSVESVYRTFKRYKIHIKEEDGRLTFLDCSWEKWQRKARRFTARKPLIPRR